MNDAPEPQDTVRTDVPTSNYSDSTHALNEKPRKSVAFYAFIGILVIGLVQLAGVVPLLLMNDTAGFGSLFGIISFVSAIPFIIVGLIGTLLTKAPYRKNTSLSLATGAEGSLGKFQKANRRWLYIFFGMFLVSIAIRIATDKFGDEILGWLINLPFGILLAFGLYGVWTMILTVGLLGVTIIAVMTIAQKLRKGHSEYSMRALLVVVLLMTLIGGGYIAAAAYREAQYERMYDEADRAVSQSEATELIKACEIIRVDQYESGVFITRLNPIVFETGWSGNDSGAEINEYEVTNADFVALKQELSNAAKSGKCGDDLVDSYDASNDL